MKTRREILKAAADECLQKLYYYAVPTVSYEQLLQDAKDGKPFDKEFWNHHYLPEDLLKEIVDSYKEAYGVKPYFKEYSDVIRDYLFKGGKKEIHVNENTVVGYRKEIVDTLPLSSLLNEKDCATVRDLFNDCVTYYRFDSIENSSFDWAVFDMAPTSNPWSVSDYWLNKGVSLNIDAVEIKKRFYKEEYGDDYEG